MTRESSVVIADLINVAQKTLVGSIPTVSSPAYLTTSNTDTIPRLATNYVVQPLGRSNHLGAEGVHRISTQIIPTFCTGYTTTTVTPTMVTDLLTGAQPALPSTTSMTTRPILVPSVIPQPTPQPQILEQNLVPQSDQRDNQQNQR